MGTGKRILIGVALALAAARGQAQEGGRPERDPRDLGSPEQTPDTFEDTSSSLGTGKGQSPVLQVRHDPVSCLVAGAYPRIEARIIPPEQVLLARVLFRVPGTKDYYSITMEKSGERFWAHLPRPRPGGAPVQYVVEGLDLAERVARSEERTAQVVAAGAACAGGAIAPTDSSATLWVEAPPGHHELPAGFADDGVTVMGSKKIGVFRLSQGAALGAALLVGAGAYAGLSHQAANADPPPAPPIDFTTLFLFNSLPAAGSTLPAGVNLFMSFRGSWPDPVGPGAVRVDFFAGPDASPCAIVTGTHFDLRGGPFFLDVTGPVSPAACPLPTAVDRIRVYVLDPAGAVAFQTGTTDLPDQPVAFTIVPVAP
jgi:hypothetical protein